MQETAHEQPWNQVYTGPNNNKSPQGEYVENGTEAFHTYLKGTPSSTAFAVTPKAIEEVTSKKRTVRYPVEHRSHCAQ